MEEKEKKDVVKIVGAIVIVILIIVVIALLVGQNKGVDVNKQVNGGTSSITDITNNGTNSTIGDIDNTNNSNDVEEKIEYKEVKIGQTVTVEEYLEYSFLSDKFTKKLNPSKPDSYYHYYEAKSSDNILLVIKTKIKNLQTEEINGEDLPVATLVYDGKYKYSCNLVLEEDDGSDLDDYKSWMEIEPLKKRTFYYYAELPKEVKNDGKSLSLIITLKDEVYEVKIR